MHINAWNVSECLQEIRLESPEIFAELIHLFVEDAERCLRDLSQHIDGEKNMEVAAALHTLKGSSRQIGADEMGELLERMEEAFYERSAGKSGSGAVRRFMPRLEECFRHTRSLMQATLGKARGDQRGNG